MRLLPWPASLLCLLLGYVGVDPAVQADVDRSAVRQIPLRSHSLSSPFLDSDMQSRYFEFGEDTIVRADQYIRLTSDRQAQSGWLFSRMPLTATNWMIEVEFKIHGLGHLHGDGMAVWLTEERAKPGNVFGHADNFNGLGIFLDTYKNSRPGVVFPYVMAMLGNSSVSYDSEHDGKDNELAGCSARGIRGNDEIPRKIRMTYYQDTSLKVELQYKAENEWTECFETEAFKLPQTAYLGFSAHTGELTDNHDIISINTYNMHIRQQQTTGSSSSKSGGSGAGGAGDRGYRAQAHPYNPGGDKERGSWRWFLFKIGLLGVAVGGGYVGYTMYRASKRNSRF